MNKPICETKDCNNVTEIHKRTVSKDYYRKICSSCKRKKYGMPSAYERDREKFRALKKGYCSLCGWKGPCDIHRIVEGYKGGQYTEGNVVEICPNCHRLEHQGLIKLTK